MLTQSEYVERFREYYPCEFTVVGKYAGGKKPVLIKCNNCGEEFHIIAQRVKYDPLSCKKCGLRKENPYAPGGFGEYVRQVSGGEYEVVKEKTSVHSKVLVRHNSCGHEYSVSRSHFT